MRTVTFSDSNVPARTMFEHQETKHLPYTPSQLFDLVADVERYPQFLPWCQRVSRIDVESQDGPFRRLVNAWTFTPQAEGCLVGFMIRFQFSSFMMGTLFQPFFGHVARSMVDAFEKRARALYR